jgi:hypothetical protein
MSISRATGLRGLFVWVLRFSQLRGSGFCCPWTRRGITGYSVPRQCLRIVGNRIPTRASAFNLTGQDTSRSVHVASYGIFMEWETSKNKLNSVRNMSDWVIRRSPVFHMCATGSLILQQTFDVYICDKMSYLESYEARCWIVSLNVIVITSSLASVEMEMRAWRDWLNRSWTLVAIITFFET